MQPGEMKHQGAALSHLEGRGCIWEEPLKDIKERPAAISAQSQSQAPWIVKKRKRSPAKRGKAIRRVTRKGRIRKRRQVIKSAIIQAHQAAQAAQAAVLQMKGKERSKKKGKKKKRTMRKRIAHNGNSPVESSD